MKKKIGIMSIIVCCFVFFAQPPKAAVIEERLLHVSGKLEKEISLTADQKGKIKNVYKNFFEAMDKLRDQPGKTPPPSAAC